MLLLSTQILIVNFLVSALLTTLVYLFNKSVRHVNPIILFIVSSVGAFLGSMLAVVFPNSEIAFIRSIIFIIPGVTLSLIFMFICVKGVKSKSFF